MKVMLVNPSERINVNTRLPESLNRAQGLYPPLGLAYIAAVLEKEARCFVEVRIIDMPALNWTLDEFRGEVASFKPDIVGITCMTATLRGSQQLAQVAHELRVKVVFGGPQMAAFPEETMSFEYVDYGIVGEGEYAFKELVEAIWRSSVNELDDNLKNIRGLIRKKDGKLIQNGVAMVDDLDALPFPARHLLPMEKYYCSIVNGDFTTMISSRGCPYKCGFCFKQPSDEKLRFRSAKNVVEEIQRIVDDYGIRHIMFYDDTICNKAEHVRAISEEILRRGIKVTWESPMRVNQAMPGLLNIMRKSGCMRLRYGVESGDPGILKLMRKGIDLDMVKAAFKMTRYEGIETFAYFIIGYARETPETMLKTINLAKELDPDWVMFTVATPYPRTHLFELAVQDGIVDPDYWKNFSLGEEQGRISFLVKDSEKYVERAYKEFYLRPEYILRKARGLNSPSTLWKYVRGAWGVISFKMK